MNKHKTEPTKINPEAVETIKDVGRYIQQFGLDTQSYVGKGDAAILSEAIAKNPDALKEYKKTAKEAVDNDRNWGVYKNDGGEKKPESNTANPYQQGISDFFNLPVPDTDEKNREKASNLEYIIDGAKKVVPAAIMAALYFSSPVADISPAAATPDISGDDDDHHSPTDPANYKDKDDITNFMEGLKNTIPVAAAAEDVQDNLEQGKPDLVVKSIDVTDYDEKTAKYKISCTIKNEGDATAPKGFLVGIYDDTGNTEEWNYFRNVLSSSNMLDLHPVDEDLNPGDEYTIPVEKEINHNLFRPIKVCVDDQVNKVDESREDNNELTYEVKQQSSSGEKPDLVIEKAWIKEDSKGKYISGCTIKNIGDAPSPGNFEVQRTDVDGGALDTAGILLPGETYTVTGGSIKTLEGMQKCTYVVDVYGDIDEKDEGNNELKLSDPRVEIREGDDQRETGGTPRQTEELSYVAKILGGAGIAAAVSGAIAYVRHKKRKSPANRARHSKSDKSGYVSKEQEPSQLRDKMHSIGELIGGKMHNIKDPYYSLKQKIGERYETHKNKRNERESPKEDISTTERTKYIENIKKAVSGLKDRTTRNIRGAKHKSPKTGRYPKTEHHTGSGAALREPNLEGLKKMSDANYGALEYTAYISEETTSEEAHTKITIVPNMHLNEEGEKLLMKHLKETSPENYKYDIRRR